MKNVLIINYTQTGQSREIVDQITNQLQENKQISVTNYTIELQENYPFPWKTDTFFDAFPETFQQIPRKIKIPSKEILEQEFDLIILSYQVWYLTPSNPIVSFLKSEFAAGILDGKKVVTVISCRNMWATAHDKMGALLREKNAERVGNIALVDRANNYLSVITIVHWLYSGNKTKYLGIFPLPGVSAKDIQESRRFAEPIQNALLSSDYSNLQQELLDRKAILFKPFLITVDRTANKIFRFWSKKILSVSLENRAKWVNFFRLYLLFAIWVISPIVLVIYYLTYPLRLKTIRKDKIRYQGV